MHWETKNIMWLVLLWQSKMISLRCAFNEEDTYEHVDDYRIIIVK